MEVLFAGVTKDAMSSFYLDSVDFYTSGCGPSCGYVD